nr:MAG TPA: hypothetical protein [Caudoviricetes sp.]
MKSKGAGESYRQAHYKAFACLIRANTVCAYRNRRITAQRAEYSACRVLKIKTALIKRNVYIGKNSDLPCLHVLAKGGGLRVCLQHTADHSGLFRKGGLLNRRKRGHHFKIMKIRVRPDPFQNKIRYCFKIHHCAPQTFLKTPQ